jgi:ABC-type transport system involved in multi-copper enzyme maturation permease subunit
MYVRGSHVRLIAVYYAKNLIRGGAGIMFTLAALFVGLIIGWIFTAPVEAIQQQQQQQFKQMNGPGGQGGPALPQLQQRDFVQQVTKEVGMPVAKWATGADDEQAEFLVKQRPALVSAMLVAQLFCMPFLICLGAFNQLAGDIQYKGLRYLLLRTERANIFLGRFIGTVVFTMAVILLVLLILFLYLALKADFYPASEVFLWLMQGYLALILFALPYIALCSWISAAMDGPGLSLLICELIAIFPIIFVAIARGMINQNLHVLGWIMPWPFKYTLLHPNPLYVLAATADMLAFTAFFMFLGLRHFQKRDL